MDLFRQLKPATSRRTAGKRLTRRDAALGFIDARHQTGMQQQTDVRHTLAGLRSHDRFGLGLRGLFQFFASH